MMNRFHIVSFRSSNLIHRHSAPALTPLVLSSHPPRSCASSSSPISSAIRRLAMSMSSSSSSSATDNMMGRIWLHRPFQVMPTASSHTSSIVHCPLPKRTPSSTSENKLQYLSSQSKRALAEIQQSKAEFYKRQFANEFRKTMPRVEYRDVQFVWRIVYVKFM